MSTTAVGNYVMVMLGASMLLSVGAVALMVHHAQRVTPWAICQRLRSGRDRVVRVRTNWGFGAWDPSKPLRPLSRTSDGPGTASYSLTLESLVRVEVRFKDGRVETREGPVVEPPDGARKVRRFMWMPTLLFLIVAITGGALGYVDGKAGGAGIGVLLGGLVGYVLIHVLALVLRLRARGAT